jgi:hypothetical protein
MPLDFPPTPSVNELYTYGGYSWIWTGSAWNVYSASLAGNTGATGPQGPQGNTGSTGPQGNTGPTGAFPTDYVISIDGITGAVNLKPFIIAMATAL